jgi:hypothetical protein
LTSLRRIIHDQDLHERLAARGQECRLGPWSEGEHLRNYVALIERCRAERGSRSPYQPAHARLRRAKHLLEQPANR